MWKFALLSVVLAGAVCTTSGFVTHKRPAHSWDHKNATTGQPAGVNKPHHPADGHFDHPIFKPLPGVHPGNHSRFNVSHPPTPPKWLNATQIAAIVQHIKQKLNNTSEADEFLTNGTFGPTLIAGRRDGGSGHRETTGNNNSWMSMMPFLMGGMGGGGGGNGGGGAGRADGGAAGGGGGGGGGGNNWGAMMAMMAMQNQGQQQQGHRGSG